MSTPSIIIRPPAAIDIDDHADYIAQSNPQQAIRFQDAVSQTFQDLAAMPMMAGPFQLANPNLQGLRFWPVQGFPNHIIYYLPTSNGIEVVRVLHGAQDAQTILEAEP